MLSLLTFLRCFHIDECCKFQKKGGILDHSAQVSGTKRGVFFRIQVVNSRTSRAYDSLRHDSMVADLVAFDAEWVPDFKGSNHPISAPWRPVLRRGVAMPSFEMQISMLLVICNDLHVSVKITMC